MIIRLLHGVEEAVLSLLLVGMTLLVFAETILRFGFGTGLLWAQELTLLMSAWFVLFGASYGVRVGAHIGVDAFVKLLPEKARRAAALLAVSLCLLYCGIFLYGSVVYLEKMHMIGIELEDLPIQKWVAQTVLVIGFALLIVRFLEIFWRIIRGKQDGLNLVDEAKESMHIAEELQSEEGARK